MVLLRVGWFCGWVWLIVVLRGLGVFGFDSHARWVCLFWMGLVLSLVMWFVDGVGGCEFGGEFV